MSSWKLLPNDQCGVGAKGMGEANEEGEMFPLWAAAWDSMARERGTVPAWTDVAFGEERGDLSP